jgi:hypothetical protein
MFHVKGDYSVSLNMAGPWNRPRDLGRHGLKLTPYPKGWGNGLEEEAMVRSPMRLRLHHHFGAIGALLAWSGVAAAEDVLKIAIGQRG